MTQTVETVIIGGGQAGLAVSRDLVPAGRENVVLEQAAHRTELAQRPVGFLLPRDAQLVRPSSRPPLRRTHRTASCRATRSSGRSSDTPGASGRRCARRSESPPSVRWMTDPSSCARPPATCEAASSSWPRALSSEPTVRPAPPRPSGRRRWTSMPTGMRATFPPAACSSSAAASPEPRSAKSCGRRAEACVLSCGKAAWVPRRIGGRDIVWWLMRRAS